MCFGSLGSVVDGFGEPGVQATAEVLDDTVRVLLDCRSQSLEGAKLKAPGPTNPALQHRLSAGGIAACGKNLVQLFLDPLCSRGLRPQHCSECI